MLTKKQIEEINERAGVHSVLGQQPPIDPEQRLYYGMMEILDWECCAYGDAPDGVTEKDIKEYLLKHKNDIKTEAVSSYLGLLVGVFDFLK